MVRSSVFKKNRNPEQLVNFHYFCLDGIQCKDLNVAIAGQISSFKVDPFHGFIFWIEDGNKLVQLEENCNNNNSQYTQQTSTDIKVLLSNGHKLGDFLLIFDQFKVQVSDLTANALLELDISKPGSSRQVLKKSQQ